MGTSSSRVGSQGTGEPATGEERSAPAQARESQPQLKGTFEPGRPSFTAPPVSFTRHAVTLWLLGIFGGTVLLHYVTFALACCLLKDEVARKSAFDFLSNMFSTAIAAEAGLVGGAMAFYFSRPSGGPND